MSLEDARTIADAVLYEGYLLYPYRASSSKNQSRWQWGVLGPPGAASTGVGEGPCLSTQCLIRPIGDSHVDASVSVIVRFLQLQARTVEVVDLERPGRFVPVPELRAGDQTWLTWDEAVAHEIHLDTLGLEDCRDGRLLPVHVDGGEQIDSLVDENGHIVGRVVRRTWPLSATVRVTAASLDSVARLTVEVANEVEPSEVPWQKDGAIRRSFIGTHLVLVAHDAEFVSLLEPDDDATDAAEACRQQRCWPVLVGPPGSVDVLLVSPIILYDYPEVAEQSAGALFDSTEIDEILTLRVMTLTDDEKAAARATDPKAAAIIDRCERMSPAEMAALHGVLRDPYAHLGPTPFPEEESWRPLPDLSGVPTFTEVPPPSNARDAHDASGPLFETGGLPWWDPATDASVNPETDGVLIEGVLVTKGSLVRIRPGRRADAQDIFFTGKTARVTAVLVDVDGQVHVAVVLNDDPAADLHEWYGRYLYFGPEELQPLDSPSDPGSAKQNDTREESRS